MRTGVPFQKGSQNAADTHYFHPVNGKKKKKKIGAQGL
jgi:hypothetical protein